MLALDVLRAVAVLLVIGRHVYVKDGMTVLSSAWQRGGWIGVDLFFVLSGFLVSGLLFREFEREGCVNIPRFLIRRGLKIYPAFFFFLAITGPLLVAQNPAIGWSEITGEVFFLQNYMGGLWHHTWSLAVEEHFYLGLALLVGVLLSQQTPSPLMALPRILFTLAGLILLLRLANWSVYWKHNSSLTHLRVDALGFGVLLSYFWQFHRERIEAIFVGRRSQLVLLGAVLLTPAFLWPIESTPAIHTVGLTVFYLACGLILMALVTNGISSMLPMRSLGYVGKHSYSIYLWHLPVIEWIVRPSRLLWEMPPLETMLFVTVVSIAIGILASHLVETPVLRLRDKFIPSGTIRLKPLTVTLTPAMLPTTRQT
ncbi:O-acetyltransferase OatA [Planctomycetes bacterium Pan216]|uniref:O-acetyltransferase OatA n=2 Tax=Kolteria novifilia TaxID=2527975 RepID=A0A518B7W1_9BACT|nr:O-acetyltransferase OatA [Planctomycetes bacterium Pan216]